MLYGLYAVQDGDTVNLKIQLGYLNEKKCKITFQENSLELQFQTKSVILVRINHSMPENCQD